MAAKQGYYWRPRDKNLRESTEKRQKSKHHNNNRTRGKNTNNDRKNQRTLVFVSNFASTTSGDTFRCSVCGRSMSMSDKEAHLNGKKHESKLRQRQWEKQQKRAPRKKRLKQAKLKELSPPDWWPGHNPWDDDTASDYDREEAAALAHDIDTQWGMLPNGGGLLWGSSD